MREEQKRDGVIDGGSPVGSEGVSKAGMEGWTGLREGRREGRKGSEKVKQGWK